VIYDFSCSKYVGFLNQVLPALGNAGAVILVTMGMSSLGALLFRRSEFRATDIFAGWGVVAAFMTLVAVLFSHALLYAAFVLAIVMIVSLWRTVKYGYFSSPFWLLALFPGLVILTALNLLGLSGWDDFSHWVPNALYIFHYNGVPGLAMPATHSAWPSYPYAVPFITYLASNLAGGFLMQGAAMFNFLLLLAFAAMLVQTSEKSEPETRINWRSVGLAALALLLVTLANPSFNASFTMTNEGDTSIMILVGALGLLLWQMIGALGLKSGSKARDIALQAALTAMALVLVKQVGVYLLGLLSFAFLVVAGKNKVLKSAMKNLPLILVPALVMHFVWQHYVDKSMGGMGFGVRPLALWRFDLVGSVLKSMWHEIVKNNGLSAITFLTIVVGTLSLFRPATPIRNFALLSAIVCSGYLAFLFVSYIGSTFSEAEIRRAASFYRYSTHIGLLGITFLWFAIPPIWINLKEKNKLPFLTARSFIAAPALQKGCVLFLVSLLPITLPIQSRWLIRGPYFGTNPNPVKSSSPALRGTAIS
jgi:hypothetical protein